MSVARTTPYKIYLLIDEYDNFANEVLMAGLPDSRKRYETLIQGEGMLKTVYKVIKGGTEGRGIDRLFITGVSPVVMSDITSGFNIAENIYLEPEFNDLCGFWETEVLETLQQIVIKCQYPPQKVAEALAMIRTFYNGYRFTYDAETMIYNPTLVLYFLKTFQRHCQYPPQILDENLALDRDKISYISQLPNGDQFIVNALNEGEPLAIAELASRFEVKDIRYTVKDTKFMVSLLYYFGLLTLSGQYSPIGKLIFKIPNLSIRQLYAECIQEL